MMKMTRHHKTGSFSACRSGVAATEFALIVPVLLALFFGVVEGSDALSAVRRVALAANTLADLTAQETEILEADADDLFEGVEAIVDTNGRPVTIRLVSVVADSNGDPIVHWSRENNGTEPYVKNTAYDKLPNKALLDVNASIIVGEISYPYESNLTHYFIAPITLEKVATRWPRRTLRIQLCKSAGVCTS